MIRDVKSPEDVTAMTAPLIVRLESKFSSEMEELRQGGWSNSSVESSRDEFDKDSFHLVVRQSGRPRGMVRITRGPRSPLLAWSGGRAPLPSNPSVAELTRAVVTPSIRRCGIYQLAMDLPRKLPFKSGAGRPSLSSAR